MRTWCHVDNNLVESINSVLIYAVVWEFFGLVRVRAGRVVSNSRNYSIYSCKLVFQHPRRVAGAEESLWNGKYSEWKRGSTVPAKLFVHKHKVNVLSSSRLINLLLSLLVLILRDEWRWVGSERSFMGDAGRLIEQSRLRMCFRLKKSKSHSAFSRGLGSV